MNKLNEAATSSGSPDVRGQEKTETENSLENEKPKEGKKFDNDAETTDEKDEKTDNEEKNVLKFTMLFNKYSCMLDMKRRNDEDKRDNKYAMFFNKEVTIRQSPEVSPATMQLLEAKQSGFLSPRRIQPVRISRVRSKFHPHNTPPVPEPQITEPEMMFYGSLFPSLPNVGERQATPQSENLKNFLSRRNSRMEDSIVQLNVHPATLRDLRNHNSLTNLPKYNKFSLKSKIPSLTALDANSVQSKSGLTRFCSWDHSDDLILMQSDVEKRLNLQISRSSNDNNRRSLLKFKKEDAASVSDSRLLYADSESKKHIKKCDKKSRGDSSRKERCCGSRKQVQWKTEVDVIYFSTHLAANGDRMGEVIGRVMEPLREEWEQQRKGFYAKVVPSHMESHIKDHFISLLKI